LRSFGAQNLLSRIPGWRRQYTVVGLGLLAAGLTYILPVGVSTGGLIPGTSGFGKTYIGFPALQAWATGAVVYLVAVALVARSSRAKALLGYSRVEETVAPAAPPAGGG
jgi:hypothetical protein